MNPLGLPELEALMSDIVPTARDWRERLAELRRKMDQSCDKGAITLRQWRVLLEASSLRQARCSGGDPTDAKGLPAPETQPASRLSLSEEALLPAAGTSSLSDLENQNAI